MGECYGVKRRKLAVGSNAEPPRPIRVNTLKMTAGDFEKLLEKEGISIKNTRIWQLFTILRTYTGLKGLQKSKKTAIIIRIQRLSFAAKLSTRARASLVTDVCAAPGGKAITAAQLMENSGEILAFDLHPFKRDMIEERARQMGATIIRATVGDAASPCPEHLKASFDRGALRRSSARVRDYPPPAGDKVQTNRKRRGASKLQYEILCSSSEMVRPGGGAAIPPAR